MADKVLDIVCKSHVLPGKGNEVVNQELKRGDVSAFRRPDLSSFEVFAFELAPNCLDLQLLLQGQIHDHWRQRRAVPKGLGHPRAVGIRQLRVDLVEDLIE